MSRRRQPPRLWFKPGERGRAGTWVIKDGQKRRGTGCGEHDLEQAQLTLARYIQGKYLPPKGLGQELLVTEVVAAYLKDYSVHSASEEFIRHTARPILEWWSAKKLSEVTGTNCRRYVTWRTSQTRRTRGKSKKPKAKISDQTARHDLKTLRAAIRWYKAEHEPALNVPTVTLPARAPRRADYWLTRNELSARIRAARKSKQTRHVARVLLIGYYTATRPGAILALRWLPSPTAGWLDVDAGVLHRRGSAAKVTNKRQPPARIHARLLPHLRRWRRLDMERKAPITFVIHYQGEAVAKLRRSWASVAHLAGAQRRDGPHILRHSCCTWLMQAGIDVYEVSGYTGVSVETLLDVYGHHHPSFQSEAASARGRRSHASKQPRRRTADRLRTD